MNSTSQSYDQIISLGYRCSSAGIIKSLGLKTESYPFDWLVSRLPIIEHCIKTDFKEFLNPDNYTTKEGTTNNYVSIDPSSRQWICNESICFNEYYENHPTQYYLPHPISTANDAYGYKLMMNHRNIKTNTQDQAYYARCIERWYKSIESQKRLVLYIHPAVFYEEFLQTKQELIGELRRAHNAVFSFDAPASNLPKNSDLVTSYATSVNPINTTCDGIYIIPVRTPFEYPTNHCAKYVLEEHPDDEESNCRVCILWANRDFIDAGEIFMGNCHVETYVIKDYLQQTVNNRRLLPNSAKK